MARFWYRVGEVFAALYLSLEPLITPVSEERRPDVLGTVLVLLSAALFYIGVRTGGMQPIVLSVAAGTELFSLGWGMYLAGMWGGADAFVLGALGYAFPMLPFTVRGTDPVFPVPVLLVMTVFFVGAVYSLLYAFGVAVQHRQVMDRFRRDIAAYRTALLWTGVGGLGVVAIGTAAARIWLEIPVQIAVQGAVTLIVSVLVMSLVYYFLQAVESDVMRQTVPVDELHPGDVLAQDLDRVDLDADRIVGLTEDQIDTIGEEYDTVEIQSGVQFIVAYPFAVLLLLWLGDPLSVLIQLLL